MVRPHTTAVGEGPWRWPRALLQAAKPTATAVQTRVQPSHVHPAGARVPAGYPVSLQPGARGPGAGAGGPLVVANVHTRP